MPDTSLDTEPPTKTPSRAGFSSRLGFVLAAAGSAVGLGNIWSYPTQVAENGGAAFVVIYFLLTILLAYPALVAELLIGRYAQSNPVSALEKLPENIVWQPVTRLTALIAVLMICLIFSFYSIVGGWIMGFTLSPLLELLSFNTAAHWLETFSPARNLLLAVLFTIATLAVVNGGVKDGIERWSSRLMPLLIVLLLALIAFVTTQPGAMEGLKHYLVPDISRIDTSLVLSALGQAFFSMSLGVGAMMVYGSYLSKTSNLPTVAFQVCMLDTAIAFLAGLLIIPALFVALNLGINIYSESGQLIHSDTLVFEVLPALFGALGSFGVPVAIAFFCLMSIAALTSSISMLEVPVSCLIERAGMNRTKASTLVCLGVLLIVALVTSSFDPLFGAIVTLTTQYAQPLNGLLFCLYAGWLMGRNRKLQEIRKGWPEVEQSLFWRIWPWYIRIVCPTLIAIIFLAEH
ncbi:sodium-dependent transporter [Parendozoicomonas haliclonae]|uniref:Sodium:neurotransmitter symporter family protein n=1 Tax=Parendozoicomonas haliclonae TaxID=1960125 RepID=A0A1X7AH48_9GAMM|nr:sodium-dependent transporter [Parendozoicomonas haliclonae]SMA40289.1 Sodium:neurotransmitter symporter family protein [Parendozoicomonas haliclonae]